MLKAKSKINANLVMNTFCKTQKRAECLSI